jgi:hypothetical protein
VQSTISQDIAKEIACAVVQATTLCLVPHDVVILTVGHNPIGSEPFVTVVVLANKAIPQIKIAIIFLIFFIFFKFKLLKLLLFCFQS